MPQTSWGDDDACVPMRLRRLDRESLGSEPCALCPPWSARRTVRLASNTYELTARSTLLENHANAVRNVRIRHEMNFPKTVSETPK
eukprot:16848-Amphidinium_carterae.1